MHRNSPLPRSHDRSPGRGAPTAARTRLLSILALALTALGCPGSPDDPIDEDGDGWLRSEDCDDTDPDVHPGADERCNGLDDDCDGVIPTDETDDDLDGQAECLGDCDDSSAATWDGAAEVCDGLDNDCDGSVPTDELDQDGDGATGCGGDCDDGDPTIHPLATEVCNAIDDDCDAAVDEDFDEDGDGATSCGADGVSGNGDDDCDDADPAQYPGAPEACNGIDDDCDGTLLDEESDEDGDGFDVCGDGDCDDTDPARFPGAAEVCNGLDNDCDGGVPADEADGDGDGFRICDGDCDDADPATFPGAPELCDGLDNDCDGAVPPEEIDDDGDTYPECQGDCDDDEPGVHPGATELCNGADDDCDGALRADEADDDADGQMICQGDCDDAEATTWGGAPEACDGVDNSCSGAIDDPWPEVGDACGGCGVWTCSATGAGAFCDLSSANNCGECGQPDVALGSACGGCGVMTCTGCVDPGLNACGGCGPVDAEVCDDGVDQDCDGFDEPCLVPDFGPGWVHGAVFDASISAPLADATVTIDDLDGARMVETDAAGQFAFPFSGDASSVLLTAEKDGYTFGQRWATARAGEDTSVEPLHLKPLDPVVSTIGALGGDLVASDGNTLLFFPPGAVSRPVRTSATWYEAGEELPGFLPVSSAFTYATELRLDDNGLDPGATEDVGEFGQPVTLRIANTRGFAPGTPVPMGYYDEELGRWLAEGMGEVDSTGLWADFQVEHFTPYDLNFPIAPPPGAEPPDASDETEEEEVQCEGADTGNSAVTYRDGKLRERYELPSWRSLDEERGLALAYDSGRAVPGAVLGATVSVDLSQQSEPGSTRAVFEIAGLREEAWFEVAEGEWRQGWFWDGTNARGEQVPTGSYPYNVGLSHTYLGEFWRAEYFGGPPVAPTGIVADEPFVRTSRLRDRAVIDNGQGSPFGAGWSLAGLAKLTGTPTGSKVLTGAGPARVFQGWGVDLVVGSGELSSDNEVLVFAGTGNASVSSQAFGVAGFEAYPSCPTVADFDGDGRMDIAAKTYWGADGITVTLGLGDGTFQPPLLSAISANCHDAVAADFDGDGVVDLAMSSLSPPADSVVVALGNGDGTFSYSQEITLGVGLYELTDIVAVDLNVDGYSDLAAVDNRSSIDEVSILLSEGDGTFAPPWTEPIAGLGGSGQHRIDTADFNLDGLPDLSIGGADAGDLSILLGQGDGTFPNHHTVSGFSGSGGHVVADFDLDGFTDVVAIEDEYVEFLPGLGDGTLGSSIVSQVFDTGTSFQTGTFSGDAVTADLDDDGDLDLVAVAACCDHNLALLLNGGDGSFSLTQALDVPGSFPAPQVHAVALSAHEGPSTYPSPPGDCSTLVRSPDGTHTRTLKDGTEQHFDEDGLIVSLVEPDGNETSYLYDAQGRIEQIVDPAGLVTTFDYGSDWYLDAITDPAGRVTTLSIDADGNLVSVEDPEGSVTSFAYDSTVSDFLLTGQTDPRGNTTTYAYDSIGRIEQVVAASGETRLYDPGATQGLVNDLPAGLGTEDNPAPVVAAGPSGFVDGMGNAFSFDTSAGGLVLGVTDPLGRTTTIERDEDGRPTSITHPTGATDSFEYDELGNLTSLELQVDAAGTVAVTTTEYDPTFNRPTLLVDPEGNETLLTYDPATGDLLSSTVVDPVYGDRVTAFAYDGYGRLVQVTEGDGSAAPRTTTFEYYPPIEGGNLFRVLDPLGAEWVVDEYDLAGNPVSVIDEDGVETRYEYDARGRVTEILWAWGSPDETSAILEYDDVGNLVAVTDGRTSPGTVSMAYDDLNLLASVTDPMGGVTSYTWDDNRRPSTVMDAEGDTTSFSYDAAGRLVEKALPGDLVTFTWDDGDNLVAVSDSDSSVTFAHDHLGQPLESTQTIDGFGSETLTWTWDLRGLPTSMTGPAGTIAYSWDASGRPRSIDSVAGLTSFDYDAVGDLVSTSNSLAGLQTDYGRDPAGDLTSILTTQGVPVWGATLDPLTGTGDVLGVTFESGASREYEYDELGQLLAVLEPYGGSALVESYSYDEVGNRLDSHLSASHTHDLASRLLEDDQYLYAWDLDGNLVERTDKATGDWAAWWWDGEDRLVGVDLYGPTDVVPYETITYRYDPLGRRIARSVGTDDTYYFHDGANLVAWDDGTLHAVVQGPGIDQPIAAVTGGYAEYYVRDWLGSVVAMVDGAGAVVQSYEYDSFGNLLSVLDPSYDQPFTYTGREWDEEAGLYYYRARYYDPATGRFLSEDPVGWLRGSGYEYVGNNPVNWVDPLGAFRMSLPASGPGAPGGGGPLPAPVPSLPGLPGASHPQVSPSSGSFYEPSGCDQISALLCLIGLILQSERLISRFCGGDPPDPPPKRPEYAEHRFVDRQPSQHLPIIKWQPPN